MKKQLLSVCVALATAMPNLWADIDVSDLYLQNAGFDDADHFDYRVSDKGNVSQEILPVFGWSKDIGVDYTVTGIYELGTSKTFNTYGKVPASGYQGSTGGCLALSTGWEESLKFYQVVELPAGTYKLQAPFYNGSNISAGESLLGWIPEKGSASMSNLSAFPLNSWTVDEVTFTLSAKSSGRVQIGFKGAPNGSANSAKVVVDAVKLIMVGNNATLVENNFRASLKNTLSDALKLYGNGSGNEAATLKAVIDAAQKVCDASNAFNELFAAEAVLKTQMEEYRLANATAANPIDFTNAIENPSFENGFTGWKQTGLQTQSNNSFTAKSGSVYAERWVNKGSRVGMADLRQTTEKLPNGVYTLKVAAQNIQQDVNATQYGVWVVVNDDSVEVSSAKDYELRFVNVDGPLDIAFVAENATGNWISVDNFRLSYTTASVSDFKQKLQRRVEVARNLQKLPMGAADYAALEKNIGIALKWIDEPNAGVESAAVGLYKAIVAAKPSIAMFGRLSAELQVAQQLYNDKMNGADKLASAIADAKEVFSTDASLDEVEETIANLQTAELMFKVANATGTAPTVTTDTRVARGATLAFGRASFKGNNIVERGFCWATHGQPTLADNHSSLSYSNNGDIFVMPNLKPATIYYIRPYAITNTYAVGYGEPVKISTLPMGNVTWTYNNGGSDEENARINAAVADAVGVFNNLTSISGLRITVSYGASTPTADCSYGGSMRVGPNASYQRTGTILHEMCHAAGVGTIDRWYNSGIYRQETSRGFWLGERTDQVLNFLENDPSAHLKGDNTHFWPYGVNGANEDTGSRMLYYANGLVIQALGEDNLPPVNGAFASPAYTFTQEDYDTYYLLPSGANFSDNAPVLRCDAGGRMSVTQKDWKGIYADADCAWKIRFNPATQLYEFKSVAADKAMAANSNQVACSLAENFGVQMLGSRQNVSNGYFNMKSYWLTFANKTNQPTTLTANNDGQSVSATRFDHQNTATQQRWIILSKRELMDLAGIDYTVVETQTASQAALSVYGGINEVEVETAGSGSWVNICNIYGQTIDRFYMQAGLRIRKSVPSGVLLVNGRKVVVYPR